MSVYLFFGCLIIILLFIIILIWMGSDHIFMIHCRGIRITSR